VPTRSQRSTTREGVSLADHAYYEIRERILKGEIPLGAPLSRRRLAAELGMSLLPVSEALQALESDGLVESRPRVGTRVCLPTAEEVAERYEVREALESQAARLYARRATPAQRREMERMGERMDALFNQCAASPNTDREFLYAVQSYHLEFHLRIAEISGCHTLRKMIEKNHVLIFNWLFDVAASRPALPPSFHSDLVGILNRANVEAADRAMRKHVRHGFDTIVRAVATRPTDIPFERVK
jgi:DNA-binding GntR family transcriptional regulator